MGGYTVTFALLLLLSFLPLAALGGQGPGPDDKVSALRPPKPEIPPGLWEQYGNSLVVAGVVVLVLVALGLWMWLRPRPPAAVPPAALAREELGRLRQQAETGAVLSHVSQVLRSYVLAAFDLEPGEMTTSEFRKATAQSEKVGAKLAGSLDTFLSECDQRKFAPAPETVPLRAVERALGLVEAVEARCAQLRAAVNGTETQPAVIAQTRNPGA